MITQKERSRKERCRTAERLIDEGLDTRQVMWELTTENLKISINKMNWGIFSEWFIGTSTDATELNFAIRIETNMACKFFTVEVRKFSIGHEDISRYGFYDNISSYLLDTDSPREVLNSIDRLIGYLKA